MKHLMIDLETLGTGDNAAIVQMAAVIFDPHAGPTGTYTLPGLEFNAHIELDDPNIGVLDAPCVHWWMQQSQVARDRVFGLQIENRVPLSTALMQLMHWTDVHCDGEELDGVWSHLAFDWRLLVQAAKRCNVRWFSRRLGCDYGTLKRLGQSLGIEEPLFVGVPHDAVDDAFHQSTYAALILQVMGALKVQNA